MRVRYKWTGNTPPLRPSKDGGGGPGGLSSEIDLWGGATRRREQMVRILSVLGPYTVGTYLISSDSFRRTGRRHRAVGRRVGVIEGESQWRDWASFCFRQLWQVLADLQHRAIAMKERVPCAANLLLSSKRGVPWVGFPYSSFRKARSAFPAFPVNNARNITWVQ